MSARHLACVEVRCDVCGSFFGEDFDATHWPSVADVIERNADPDDPARWLIRPDGYAICHAQDLPHQAAMDGLLPAEPTPVIDGQQEIALSPTTDDEGN